VQEGTERGEQARCQHRVADPEQPAGEEPGCGAEPLRVERVERAGRRQLPGELHHRVADEQARDEGEQERQRQRGAGHRAGRRGVEHDREDRRHRRSRQGDAVRNREHPAFEPLWRAVRGPFRYPLLVHRCPPGPRSPLIDARYITRLRRGPARRPCAAWSITKPITTSA
jgi:hypothetical protein